MDIKRRTLHAVETSHSLAAVAYGLCAALLEVVGGVLLLTALLMRRRAA